MTAIKRPPFVLRPFLQGAGTLLTIDPRTRSRGWRGRGLLGGTVRAWKPGDSSAESEVKARSTWTSFH